GFGGAEAAIPDDLSGHVIIAGYGRSGQILGSVLDAQGLYHVGLDRDADLVARNRASGAGVFYGDASRADLLVKLGAEEAAALVVTIDTPDTAEQVVVHARLLWPELAIYARARDAEHARRLLRRGASHVIPESIEASLQLGEMVLIGVGVPSEAARRAIDARRQSEQEAIDAGLG
ncbi:MAG: potassium transporter TrkA, partial [Gemmatimonadetes bacterium]|nr:potassium transporter TrkA [Gemmatimonadota bacterium]